MERTITVKRKAEQLTIKTSLTEEDSIAILREHLSPSNRFACDLVDTYEKRQHQLSPRQWEWVLYLAQEEMDRQKAVREVESKGMEPLVHDERQMDGVVALFQRASKRLQKPSIELVAEDRQRYKLYVNLSHHRYPGQISVAARGLRLGRITLDGLFLPEVPTQINHPHLVDLLYQFSQNPAKVAGEQGRRLGRCCFCLLRLTDERSLEVGYGPICARNYGLNWGDKIREALAG